MILFYILILSLPLTQHWLLGTSGAGISVVKYIGLACVPIALLRLATKHRSIGSIFPAPVLWCLGYFLCSLISLIVNSGFSALELQNVLSIMGLLLITVALVDSLPRLRWVLLVTIGSVALASVFAIREWLQWRSAIIDYRAGNISGDSNLFALCAAAGMALAFPLMTGRRPRWERLYLLGCFGLSLLAFVLAASRGGYVGLAAAFLFLMYHSRNRIRNFVLLGLMLLPVLAVVNQSPLQRFLHPGYGDEVAIVSRQIAWKAGLRMFAAHPFTGVGLARFKTVMPSYEEPGAIHVESMAHNMYIEVAAEQGLIGLVMLAGVLLAAYISAGRVVRHSTTSGDFLLRDAAVGLEAALIASSVCGFFLSAWFFRFFWFVVFLVGGVGTISASAATTKECEAHHAGTSVDAKTISTAVSHPMRELTNADSWAGRRP